MNRKIKQNIASLQVALGEAYEQLLFTLDPSAL